MTSAELPRVRAVAKFLYAGEEKFFLKGVTYGPFKPDASGHFKGSPERARADLRMIAEAGFNTVRVYHLPPRWFLDLCAETAVRVLVSIPWAKHVEFLDGDSRRQIIRQVREAVLENVGHPAVLGYLVGNEVPSAMARWLGVDRVRRFLERLVATARAADPDSLISYASFPPTEYLLPQNVDFVCFNVYLHDQSSFDRYLLRLQNLAEDRPLVLGEFGVDTIRHSEKEQAEMLGWHLNSVIRCGLAGTIFFSWTDEWYTGDAEIKDWAFGLVTRERHPKKALLMLRDQLGPNGRMPPWQPPKTPFVSVIVCSYNGGRTLAACLESLRALNYSNYEVILVDDGSTDDTATMAKRFPFVRYLYQPNHGLSHARNTGAAAAKGEIFAYTDSDCMADPEWLKYLIDTLVSGNFAGVGGPNISPPAKHWVQACVAAAPGGPSHVLLTDVVAEHVPGCNMAWYRWAFENVGGFDPEYRQAGDDVDFCWRIQQAGGAIGFSPAAIVWHHRRFTVGAFWRQQKGYGEAESMLRFKHLVFFGPTGTAKWRGQIYGTPRFGWVGAKPIIYHGLFGEGFFQAVYPTPQSEIAAYLSSIEWAALALFLFGLGLVVPDLRIIPVLMLAGTLSVAFSYMLRARIEPRFDTIKARLLVMFLALIQPLVRGWSRYFTWLQSKRTPRSVISTHERLPPESRRGLGSGRLTYWSEEGVERIQLLPRVLDLLEREGWRYSVDTGWNDWDVQIYGSFWWSISLHTVTEFHGGPKCLTRVGLCYRMVPTTMVVNLVLLALLIYRYLAASGTSLWLIPLYLLFLGFLGFRAHRLRRRVAELVDFAAVSCGLTRIGKEKPASVEATVEAPEARPVA